VEQLSASARAAIDELVRRGVCDPSRVAVGGHSYGAFMTANLLAHTDLFAAGFAFSGAYNRTLTPFGFQSEDRTLLAGARRLHGRCRPLAHADEASREPLLVVHGELDPNPGTNPLQSERLYDALKGLGGTCPPVHAALGGARLPGPGEPAAPALGDRQLAGAASAHRAGRGRRDAVTVNHKASGGSMSGSTVFARIVEGTIPADVVYRDERVTAFRDIHPQAPVHILVIPNREIPSAADLVEQDEALVGHMVVVASRIAREQGIAEEGYRLLINCRDHGGQEVYHLHLHLLGGRPLGPMLAR
jgi:histidine triad (HIT) family protein